MQLTRHTDYALRMLIFLGRSPDRLCSIAEIAQAHEISRTHLMKIASHLVQAGFVEGVRGRAGGLRLARPAALINLDEVLRVTEPSQDLVNCSDCKMQGGCTLPAIFAEGLNAFHAVMAKYTLADFLPGVPAMPFGAIPEKAGPTQGRAG